MSDNIQIDNHKRFLGFKIVGMSNEELIEHLKKSSLKRDFTKTVQEYTPFDPIDFDKAFTKSLKSYVNHAKGKGSVEKDKNKPVVVNAINTTRLNEVDRAFYQSNSRNGSILSDADANKNKVNTVNINQEYNPEDDVYAPLDVQQAFPKLETGDAFCICERLYDGKLMFQCDYCENWFHPECLGMSKDEIRAKEQQGDKELWFHSDECKTSYLRKNIRPKKSTKFTR